MHVKKESQQNRKPMMNFMNLLSRYSAKDFRTCLPRLHRKARWKPNLKVNYLWARGLSSIQRTSETCFRRLAPQTYSEWNIDDKNWSSQEWKSGERPRIWQVCRTMMPWTLFTVAESNQFIMNDHDRSWTRVNDRLCQRCQDRSPEDAMHKTSTNVLWLWWMFMSSTLEASVFHVKELLRQF